MNQDLFQYLNSSLLYAGFHLEEKPARARFLEKFVKLSPSLKDFLASLNSSNSVSQLGSQQGLSQNQITLLAIISRYLIVGEIAIKDLPLVTARILKISQGQALNIANLFLSQIPGYLMEEIKKLQPRETVSPIPSAPPAEKPSTPPPSLHEQNMANILNLREKE